MDDIADILNKYGLADKLDVSQAANQNPWILMCQIEGARLCGGESGPFKTGFCFIDDSAMQAVAIQGVPNLVAMYFGMFSLICSLNARIVSRGIFPAMGSGNAPGWEPDLKRSFEPTQKLLGGVPFDWKMESVTWIEDGERQILFWFLLSTMFRFVVLHELGHIVNDHHCKRKARGGRSAILVDATRPEALPPDRAIESQAREIIADAFAFDRLNAMLDQELELKRDLDANRVLRKLVPNKSALIAFILQSMYLYFKLTDREDWRGEDLETLSHPPAPFRLKAICATFLEINNVLEISEKEVGVILLMAIRGGDAIMSVAMQRYPDPHWMDEIGTKKTSSP